MVIGFTWNGNPVFNNKEQPILFRLAEGAAIQTGEIIFRDFLLDLKTACPKTKINVGTHSLGALVALTALKRSAKIDTLILTNPAVEDDVFKKGKAFEKVPDNVTSIIIATNKKDPILAFPYTAHEHSILIDIALGLNGPADRDNIARNIKTVDYTRDFGFDHSAVYDNAKNKRFWENVYNEIN